MPTDRSSTARTRTKRSPNARRGRTRTHATGTGSRHSAGATRGSSLPSTRVRVECCGAAWAAPLSFCRSFCQSLAPQLVGGWQRRARDSQSRKHRMMPTMLAASLLLGARVCAAQSRKATLTAFSSTASRDARRKVGAAWLPKPARRRRRKRGSRGLRSVRRRRQLRRAAADEHEPGARARA